MRHERSSAIRAIVFSTRPPSFLRQAASQSSEFALESVFGSGGADSIDSQVLNQVELRLDLDGIGVVVHL